MKMKKVFTTLLAITLIGASITACTQNNNSGNNQGATTSNKPSEKETTTVSDTPKEATEPKEFRFTIASDPPTLDPGIMTDAQSSIVGSGIYEGLMRLNNAGEPELGIASEWKVSDDGKTYTFNLRKDATWSNGDPVTAYDFEYSWKRSLDPELASDYAYFLFYLENGEEYNSDLASADDVGVTALDEYTLEARLHTATPYFVSLLSHYTYWPVHQATVESRDDWAAEASTLVTNGPYLLDQWSHGDKLVLTKNPNYFNADKINFDKVTISIVEEESTVYNLFETDKIDWIGAQAGSVPQDRMEDVIAKDAVDIKAISSVYYYLFNTTAKPFNNAKVRKAFSMSIDRQAIIDNVAKANQTPAYGLVPPSIAGTDGKLYRELYPDTAFFKEDVAEAQKLLAEGLAEEGLSSFPETTLLYNTSEGHKALAEAVVDMWRKNLGVEMKLSNQEWGTFLETRSAQQFSIARGGWGADFNHAINFTYDLIHSASGNNDGKYSNPKVDQLLNESLSAANEKERLAKIAEAEKITFADDMALLPLYYYTTATMIKPGFVGVASDYSGHIDWVFGDKQ